MKKLLLVLIPLAIGLWVPVNSQTKSQHWCGFDDRLQQELKNNPGLQVEFEQWREQVRNSVLKMEIEKSPVGTVQIIPVVVHVIHDNGVGNISEAQIKDGIRVLNEDFMRINADTTATRAVFKPYAGVADFEFRLAQIDPNGSPTNGIVRKNSQLTYNADDNTKTLSYWNSSKYFNIWLVNTISGSSQTSTILGYAQFPGWGNWNKYGVIMLHSQFGRFGSSSSDGRTTTHEVGHCLNLFHTFEGSCGSSNCTTNGDDVCDTPPTDYATYACSNNQNLCSNDAGGNSPYTTDVEDQVENFMSYDACQNMFTTMQVSRMKAAINANTQLQNLVSPGNLATTGVDELYAADFNASATVVCAGQTVNFADFSYFGQTSWAWNFQGGSPSTSTIQNPEVIYSTPGLYSVSLTTSDGLVTKSKTANNYVLVVNPDSNYLPLSEGFENNSLPNYKWYIGNLDNDASAFQRITGVGYNSNACVKLDNSGNSMGNKDELIIGSFDFSNMTAVSISFKAAYTQKDTSTKDKLMVYVSTNCGYSWSPRYAKVGSTLASAPAQTTAFTPADSSDWKNHVATLTGSMFTTNVMIKFVFESDEGNNFYLDNININGTYNVVPVLKFPVNNAGGIPDNVTVDWMSVGGVTLYQHQLDTTSNFNSPMLDEGQHNFISNDPNGTDTEHPYSGLWHGQKYFWRARTVSGSDTSAWSATWNFIVSLDGLGIYEKRTELQFTIYPNPSDDIAVIAFSLKKNTATSLEIYNVIGEKISTLLSHRLLDSGEYSFSLITENFIPGLYFVKMTSGEGSLVKKFVVE